jgi:hypothetical protein
VMWCSLPAVRSLIYALRKPRDNRPEKTPAPSFNVLPASRAHRGGEDITIAANCRSARPNCCVRKPNRALARCGSPAIPEPQCNHAVVAGFRRRHPRLRLNSCFAAQGHARKGRGDTERDPPLRIFARKIGQIRHAVYASPQYLKGGGAKTDDLRDHSVW